MVSKKKISKAAVATTAVATFGVAMTSMYLAPEIHADILDITWSGGDATASNPFADNSSGGCQPFDMDQVLDATLIGGDFCQWNDTFGGTGRTMSIASSNTGIARHRLASASEVLNPATFTGTIANGLGGTEFDGSGTLFIGFQESGSNNVGWYQIAFSVGGPIIYGPGQIGSMGENVTVGGGDKGCDFPLGDVNQNGVVSLTDVAPFVALLSSGGFLCEADINENGVVSLTDVAPFVTLLQGG